MTVADVASDHTISAEQVSLSLPARPEFFILARMNASVIASRIDFNVEEIEDLKLAVNELCTLTTMGSAQDAQMTLRYSWHDDSIEIVCEASPVVDIVDSTPELKMAGLGPVELAQRLLDELVDEHDCQPIANGMRQAVLRKTRDAFAGELG